MKYLISDGTNANDPYNFMQLWVWRDERWVLVDNLRFHSFANPSDFSKKVKNPSVEKCLEWVKEYYETSEVTYSVEHPYK